MKKAIAISSLLLGVVFLSGCGQQLIDHPQSKIKDSSAMPADKKIAANIICGEQVKDTSGITYGTVLAEDGKCWLDRNLGATKVAKTPDDDAAYGWYFQWGRSADGHQLSDSSVITIEPGKTDKSGHGKFIAFVGVFGLNSGYDNNKLWQGADGINNPCPKGFRVPTVTDWSDLFKSAKITNAETAFSSSLKLPEAGFRDDLLGTLFFKTGEMWGGYWSSNLIGADSTAGLSQEMAFNSTFARPDGNTNASYGLSVRCIKN